MEKSLRIVFAGTPDFAAQHLRALLEHSNHQVVAVYTQPDRPAGRGKKLRPSPVKTLALKYQLPLFQPVSLKEKPEQVRLRALQADIVVVVAYGLLLPKAVLAIPPMGCINVHGSLLPRWRGAAPIQRAIEAGDLQSGITIMQMDEGLDTGGILLVSNCNITTDDTSANLHDKLASLGCNCLIDALNQLSSQSISAQTQPAEGACYAAKISKQEAEINWDRPATEIDRQIRAFNPFPVAYTYNGSKRLKIWQASIVSSIDKQSPGTITNTNGCVVVACSNDAIALQKVQLEGGRAMNIEELLKGHASLFRNTAVLGHINGQ